MTRRLAKLATIYLLLGLAATWVVAWGLVLMFPMHIADRAQLDFPGNSRGDLIDGAERLTAWAFARPGSVRRMWYVQVYEPWSLESSPRGAYATHDTEPPRAVVRPRAVGGPLAWGNCGSAVREFQDGGTPAHGLEDARGWPALALTVRYTGFDPYKPSALHADGGVMLPASPSARSRSFFAQSGPDAATACALPITPIWPGLLANTLFYALLFATLHQLTTHTRRAHRRKRNRCPTCNYDLTGIEGPCPECGRTAPHD